VITNCDDDLFAASNRALGIEFDWIVTAQSVGSYKPNRANFEAAFARLGLPRNRILHVAQSLFHDHVPAQELGLSSVWIDRRRDQAGPGATPPATVITDAVFPDMVTFAEAALADRS
jgi:2-haloacid dehalogenase